MSEVQTAHGTESGICTGHSPAMQSERCASIRFPLRERRERRSAEREGTAISSPHIVSKEGNKPADDG